MAGTTTPNPTAAPMEASSQGFELPPPAAPAVCAFRPTTTAPAITVAEPSS